MRNRRVAECPLFEGGTASLIFSNSADILLADSMLTNDQVLHVATLARLTLASDEVGRTAKELQSILEYVAKMQEVDTRDVTVPHPTALTPEVMRPDEVRVGDVSSRHIVLADAPAREGDLIKVRAVFE